MRIALDALGGDHAPMETVKGAVEYIKRSPGSDVIVMLFGPEDVLKHELAKYSYDNTRIELHNTTQFVEMNEKPARIHKLKPDSSLVRAVKAVADGAADGVISAGNTGALLSSSLFLLKRIEGVRRPAIAAYIPTSHGGFIICDGGANVDVRPSDLVQFGIMGRSYSKNMFHKATPRVGIINIGTESGKGNDVTLQAIPLLEQHLDNFVGSVEGRGLFHDMTDVVVCDGFVGNILIKFGEGLVSHVGQWATSKVKKHPVSMLAVPLMKPALKDLLADLDHEEYGGWPLLGVNGVSMVSHGSSSSRAIRNAISSAAQCVDEGLIESIERGIKAHLDIFEDTSANGTT